jgi:hypothetical protein
VVLDHLQGRYVIGVYPLLQDERCQLLAVDFDKEGWTEDAGAFAATCHAVGVPVAIERSRSGNGAHAWLFFEAPVPAVLARRLGCYLLTETMSRRPVRHGLADRLFPNQDTMPKGGFGNLIALPLQHEARQQQHSAFFDEALQPLADQWGSWGPSADSRGHGGADRTRGSTEGAGDGARCSGVTGGGLATHAIRQSWINRDPSAFEGPRSCGSSAAALRRAQRTTCGLRR